MAKKILTNLDLSQNEVQNSVLQVLASAPSTPTVGQRYYDSTLGYGREYNGSGWQRIGGDQPGVTLSDSNPDVITPDQTIGPGTDSQAARADHSHGIASAIAGASAVGDSAATGTSSSFSRADHRHSREAFGAVTAQTSFGASSANGSASTVARSDHTHGTPTHDAAAHSAIKLSDLAAPTANVSFGSQRITNLADPVSANDAANKSYVDSVAQGLDAKDSARAATTTNITLSGTQTVDGVSLVVGNRVLVKNQSTASQNGLYVVASGAWTRATDMDGASEFAGAFIFVEEGTTNADSGWVCTTDNPITVGTTSIAFAQFSGAGQITAGAGLTKTGNTLDVGAGLGITVNSDDIAVTYGTVGSIASLTPDIASSAGVANSAARVDHVHNVPADTAVGLNAGSTNTEGASTSFARANHTHALDVTTGTNSTVAAGNSASNGTAIGLSRKDHQHAVTTGTAVGLNASSTNTEGSGTALARAAHTHAITGFTQKYETTIGNGSSTSITVTHNLNSRSVVAQVYRTASPYDEVEVDISRTTVNTLTVAFSVAPSSGEYTCVVIG